jgi:hypothetical protein
MDVRETEIQSIIKSELNESLATMLKEVSKHQVSPKFIEWFGEYETCPTSLQGTKLRCAQKLTLRYRQGP